jgi:hypothetical protein
MQAFTVDPARWRTVRAFGRSPFVRISDRIEVRDGNLIDIWVDAHGNRVSPPPPPSQAPVDAVCIAVTIWLGVVAAAAALAALVRWRLDRLRHAAWEREIRSLDDNDGG